MEEKLSALGQAGADEEKAWGSRGIQGKTGQRQHWTLGTLDRQLQVSDWGQEQQRLCEWKKIKFARSWTCAAATGRRISSLPPHVCRSRVGLPDTRQPLPSPRSSCHATLTRYRFLCTASLFFFLYRCFVLVSALRFAEYSCGGQQCPSTCICDCCPTQPNALS